eukprot:4796996-Pyramimonas_sp.AAC.1
MNTRLGYGIDWDRLRASYLRHSRADGRGKGSRQQTSWRDRATSSWDTWGSWQGEWSDGWRDDRWQTGGKRGGGRPDDRGDRDEQRHRWKD